MRPQKFLSLPDVLELPAPQLGGLLALVRDVQFVDCCELAEAGEGVCEEVVEGGQGGAEGGRVQEGEEDGVDCEEGEC